MVLILGTPKSELDRFVGCVEMFLERHKALVSLRGLKAFVMLVAS